ncbi:nicotinate-nucleotide pyrophosphorylase [Sorangium cellulosum]|uniref:Probable nicotinate-nucleotide pyrophosphorylase [carboxylating] n=2 Tax=Sorangium cellulosum TaxID=56 RepID=A0A4P2PY58_SORCE|nr:carboxylating nicotinate-nucleotide diphosphorylase [Sorangium cellulosum]AUX21815.1 nicotinate-nucleotide pyrophosphorylase [Sorangium cellulosum]
MRARGSEYTWEPPPGCGAEEMPVLAAPLLDALIDRALDEDLAGGDLTTEACIDASARATAKAVARGPLVACGGAVFLRVFQRLDPEVEGEALVADGARVDTGAVLWTVRGRARALLSGERTALNLAQRMSGIATEARRYADALPAGSGVRITDTRKTTPGLRALERYAVRIGGAHNHRDSLGSAVLIKDNHIVAAGGISTAIARARARAPHTTKIEVEVASLQELDEALAAGADIIMLDNFTLADVKVAAARARRSQHGRPLLEVSGGITLERIPELAAAGVDVISVGALTHSARSADIALDLAL